MSFPQFRSPAKAGAQLRCIQLASAELRYEHLSNWALAFAGEQL